VGATRVGDRSIEASEVGTSLLSSRGHGRILAPPRARRKMARPGSFHNPDPA
jgi:hypothetical protein